MKRFISIVLCLQIISGNTFGAELMKIPFAVKHYFTHEATEHPGLTVTEFLYEHYVSDASGDCGDHASSGHHCEKNHTSEGEGHCDEDLPFKHCGDCHGHFIISLLCTLPENTAELSFNDEYQHQPVEIAEQFVSTCNTAIWQPPKIG